ncbi:hypothetical protein F5Y18DRAFT_251038 [Xylariaceae sp. FL1019]|nr:hypothetical protein F5Y18DRAFT_251038 [Xylariaceae sp. FL1019]
MDTSMDQRRAVLAALQKLTRVLFDSRPMSMGEAWELCLPSCPVVLSSPFGLRQTTLDAILIGSESLSTALSQYARDKEPEVWLDENIAAAWCDYQQAGSLVAFAWVSGRWKVSGLASTSNEKHHLPPEPSDRILPQVVKPINALLSAFATPDWATLKSHFLPGAECTLYRYPAPPMRMTTENSIVRLQGLGASRPGGSTIRERIFDVDCRKRADIAFVWAPFKVEFGGVDRHEGVNIFTLLKKDEEWVLCGCQDFAKDIAQ